MREFFFKKVKTSSTVKMRTVYPKEPAKDFNDWSTTVIGLKK